MPNRLDTLAFQFIQTFKSNFSHVAFKLQIIPLTVNKSDFISEYGLNMLVIPAIPSAPYPISVYILNSCFDKINLGILSWDTDGIAFFIHYSLFDLLPSSFQIYVKCSNKETEIKFPIFSLEGSVIVKPEDTIDYSLRVDGQLSDSVPVFWSKQPNMSIISYDQTSCIVHYDKFFVDGILTVNCILFGYNLSSSLNITASEDPEPPK